MAGETFQTDCLTTDKERPVKTSSTTVLALGCVIVMALTGAATAGSDNANDINAQKKGKGGGVPAAPEPGLLLMAASGVALGGGYIFWRRRQSKNTPTT